MFCHRFPEISTRMCRNRVKTLEPGKTGQRSKCRWQFGSALWDVTRRTTTAPGSPQCGAFRRRPDACWVSGGSARPGTAWTDRRGASVYPCGENVLCGFKAGLTARSCAHGRLAASLTAPRRALATDTDLRSVVDHVPPAVRVVHEIHRDVDSRKFGEIGELSNTSLHAALHCHNPEQVAVAVHLHVKTSEPTPAPVPPPLEHLFHSDT
jgi:hypothetical protein